MKKTLVSIAMLALAGSAFAASPELEFDGEFADGTCKVLVGGVEVNGANPTKPTINLGQFTTSEWQDKEGQFTTLKPVKIEVSGCNPNTIKKVQFSVADPAGPKTGHTDVITLNSSATATGVGVAVFSQPDISSQVNMNVLLTEITLDSSGAGEGTFYAAYKILTGAVTPGKASATGLLQISYYL